MTQIQDASTSILVVQEPAQRIFTEERRLPEEAGSLILSGCTGGQTIYETHSLPDIDPILDQFRLPGLSKSVDNNCVK